MSEVAVAERPVTDSLVTVFGGSGFLGRYVVRALAKRGYRIRVPVRRPELAGFLQPLGYVGQIHVVQANVRYPDSVARAAQGSDAVLNLTGILAPSGRQTFEAVHVFGAKAIATAAAGAGARLVHVSAIGADPKAESNMPPPKARVRRWCGRRFPRPSSCALPWCSAPRTNSSTDSPPSLASCRLCR